LEKFEKPEKTEKAGKIEKLGKTEKCRSNVNENKLSKNKSLKNIVSMLHNKYNRPIKLVI
jgi:hypothetical protein